MFKRFTVKKLIIALGGAGLIGFSQYAAAGAFQLWEQDGASIGNYHAGIAATAQDASTGFYNPAGLVMLKNQQFVLGSNIVDTDFRFHGTVNVDTVGSGPQFVNVQGGGFNYIPDLHYAAPITDNAVFGFSIVVPFGLKTNYGTNTPVRYAATLSQIQVIDFTPALGVGITDKLSVGAGLDIEHMNGEFNQYAGLGTFNDTISNNSGSDNAYGYHAGILYQFNEHTRAGLDYHSQVVHHLNGNSNFLGTLANFPNLDPNGSQVSNDFTANMTLPPIATLSLFHNVNNWDFLASVSYTQWSTFNTFILKNVAGMQTDPIMGFVPSNNLQVIINEGFRNAWNYSVGANYHPNDKWIFRTGLGYDQSPAVEQYRSLQIPDSDRIAAAVGAHYQATKALGFDVGWTHLFVANTRINNLAQIVGPETVTTDGSVHGGADVIGGQIVWDIA